MASRVTGISLAPTVNRSHLLFLQVIVIGRRDDVVEAVSGSRRIVDRR